MIHIDANCAQVAGDQFYAPFSLEKLAKLGYKTLIGTQKTKFGVKNNRLSLECWRHV